ncbi:hypothetical protein NDU88_011599 [Pleurodeles waltl]|uniref:Uncharacterized protein n=1 Tax=Pleurodeles waltl TaxID=8319 RepID=A0AAV7R3U7_PLEWA|nr:hypothetical protein NDU88_011599 [Pleurodeles waltl]
MLNVGTFNKCLRKPRAELPSGDPSMPRQMDARGGRREGPSELNELGLLQPCHLEPRRLARHRDIMQREASWEGYAVQP